METEMTGEDADRLWDDLAEKLAGYPAPAFRKAYLSHFLASGRGFAASGNARGAEYCFAKLREGLEAPAAPAGRPAGERPEPPLDRLGGRWRGEKARAAAALLARHARKLSPLEAKSYREKLAKLQASAGNDGEPLRAGRMRRNDQALLDLRRKLYGRILQSQKAALGFGRDAAWERPGSRAGEADRLIGPYNDRHNLEGLLDHVAGLDAAWVDGYLAHYRNLFRLKGLFADRMRSANK